MKKSILALLFLSLFSCSDDEETPDNNNLAATTYFNLTTNNFWKYRIETKNGTEPTVVDPDLDHLKVGADEVIYGVTYKKMEAVGNPSGFYTEFMDQKRLRKVSDRIELTGNILIELGNNIPIQSIPVENFIVFKESAGNNVDLSSKTGTLAPIPVMLPINGTNVNANLLIDYTLKSVSVETLGSFTPPVPNSGVAAATYANVKSVKFILNLKVIAGGLPISVTVLNPQDVIVSTSYLAKNIGVVYTQNNTNFSFANTPGTTTPFFPPSSILQREYLNGFLNN